VKTHYTLKNKKGNAKMISTTIFPGRYLQGSEALTVLGEEISRFGKQGFIVCDPFVRDQLFPSFQDTLDRWAAYKVVEFGGECSDEEINRLAYLPDAAQSQVIVGIGGGKTLDTAKAVAGVLGAPVIVAPTIASTDASCSALAVIYTSEGKFKRYQYLPRNPEVVILDTNVIANAPVRFLVSGMGEALATWFEADSCYRRYDGNETGRPGSMTAYALAHLCYETLMDYGVDARSAGETHTVVPAFERVVEANTLLSGLGIECGGLAAAHAIHNGLTALDATHYCFHGEKVAFSTLASLFLTGKEPATIQEVYTFCEAVGLPTTLAEIGLPDVSDVELMAAARAACAPGETIYNEPVPITPQRVFTALKAADSEGKWRLMI
jgi:glycerol dehydrogenase